MSIYACNIRQLKLFTTSVRMYGFEKFPDALDLSTCREMAFIGINVAAYTTTASVDNIVEQWHLLKLPAKL
ncbi:hypothetical protein RR46_12183 [Papilio xuthus]|uniref:Uncharacterized protein n=1 Tax=Papilio xuthus TaxID=66420 RepID=A0A194PR04_PAPXU|nr:hypothetical protein RR46_12183 [Papilio xuthus]